VRSQLARSHAMLGPDSVAKWALLGQTNSPLIPLITECKLFFAYISITECKRFFDFIHFIVLLRIVLVIGHRHHKPLK
jgi:hypothetical protein